MAGYVVTLVYTVRVPVKAVSQQHAIDKAQEAVPNLIHEMGLPIPVAQAMELTELPSGIDLWYGVSDGSGSNND